MQDLINSKDIPETFISHPDLSENEVVAQIQDRQSPSSDWEFYTLKVIPEEYIPVREVFGKGSLKSEYFLVLECLMRR